MAQAAGRHRSHGDRIADAERAGYEQRRGTAAKRGYGPKWRKARAGFLRNHPYCDEPGCGEEATEVDHSVAHRGDMAIFWDKSKWRPKCKTCHSRKTVREDGGFGNAPTRKVERTGPRLTRAEMMLQRAKV